MLARGLENTGMYHPLRNAYLRVFKHDYWEQQVVSLRRFYAPFVRPGSLVFDCGANRGDFTQAFLHLGATVIAIEPMPAMIAKLRLIRNKRLTVVPCAVGKEPGLVPLYVSERSDISSLSSDWLSVVSRNDGWARELRWTGTVNCTMSTLDALIEQFGMPEFIKIDVEGFELEVLCGLTKRPRLLSFEFNSASIDSAHACIGRFPADAEFNYIIGEPAAAVTMALSEWVDAQEMTQIIHNTLACCRTFGDIFVRCALNI
jgi:FkbM family methyltransferase